MNRTNLKIFLGVCAICGIGCTIYHYISKNSKIHRREEREEKEEREEREFVEKTRKDENSNNILSEETIQIIIVFTEDKDSGEVARQNRAINVKKQLESEGFNDIKILLSKNLSANATQEQINTLKETRKDIIVLERN